MVKVQGSATTCAPCRPRPSSCPAPHALPVCVAHDHQPNPPPMHLCAPAPTIPLLLHHYLSCFTQLFNYCLEPIAPLHPHTHPYPSTHTNPFPCPCLCTRSTLCRTSPSFSTTASRPVHPATTSQSGWRHCSTSRLSSCTRQSAGEGAAGGNGEGRDERTRG